MSGYSYTIAQKQKAVQLYGEIGLRKCSAITGISRPTILRWNRDFIRNGSNGLLRKQIPANRKATDPIIVKQVHDLKKIDPKNNSEKIASLLNYSVCSRTVRNILKRKITDNNICPTKIYIGFIKIHCGYLFIACSDQPDLLYIGSAKENSSINAAILFKQFLSQIGNMSASTAIVVFSPRINQSGQGKISSWRQVVNNCSAVTNIAVESFNNIPSPIKLFIRKTVNSYNLIDGNSFTGILITRDKTVLVPVADDYLKQFLEFRSCSVAAISQQIIDDKLELSIKFLEQNADSQRLNGLYKDAAKNYYLCIKICRNAKKYEHIIRLMFLLNNMLIKQKKNSCAEVINACAIEAANFIRSRSMRFSLLIQKARLLLTDNQAIKAVDILTRLVKKAPDEDKVRALLLLGHCYKKLNMPQRAQKAFLFGYQTAYEGKDRNVYRSAVLNYASYLDFSGYCNKAVKLLLDNKNFFDESDAKSLKSNFLYNLALSCNNCGNFIDALNYYQESLSFANKEDYELLLKIKSGVLLLKLRTDSDQVYYRELDAMYAEACSNGYSELAAHIARKSGLACWHIQDFIKAEFYFNEAVKLSRQIGIENYIQDRGNLGLAYLKLQKYVLAEKQIYSQLSFAKKYNLPHQQLTALSSLAAISLTCGKYERCRKLFIQAEAFIKRNTAPYTAFKHFYNKTCLFIQWEKQELAALSYKKASQAAKKNNNILVANRLNELHIELKKMKRINR